MLAELAAIKKSEIAPSCMTAMRSLTPMTSSMSLEIIRIATPASEGGAACRRSPVLAPTSMPRVGSSKISTFGRIESHLASTTFC